MVSYNPLQAPDPAEWLKLDDMERIMLVEKFHKEARTRLPNHRLHATFHTIVENQVAEGSALPVRETLDRMMAEGLDRHDAIHAIGSVLVGSVYDIMKGAVAVDPNQDYFRGLEELTAQRWRESGQQTGGG